jgi:predicted aspartyl protease
MKPNFALTKKWNGIANALDVPVGVSVPFIPDGKELKTKPDVKSYNAVWDTGATHSVITPKIVQDLNLQPIGITIVHTANGPTHQKQYMVNYYLPNKVMIPMLTVTEAPLHGLDVLIGMDIICQGDFIITNFQGKTALTFRMPSCEEIDFVKDNNYSKLSRSERRRIERERGKL